MELKIKKVEGIVISLTAEQAEYLKAILNVSYSSVKDGYPRDCAVIEGFSNELFDELDSLGVGGNPA